METRKMFFSRRNILKGSAASLAAAALGSSSAAFAQQSSAPTIRPLTGKMTYEEVRNRAREMMIPRCYVCPECNGRGPCIGQVPGFGGMGASRGFQANYDSLAAVQLNSRVVHGVHVPDTSIDFFGTKISMPVIAAPTGGTTYNMGGKLTEEEFVNAICGGCNKAGTLGAVADGIGDPLPVYENERGTFIFNSKDLCMIEHIPDLLKAGIDSLKIEGRMKTALYVATVARTYRKAIDDYQKDPELYKKNMPWYLEQISNCTYRQFTTGFFFGKPDETTQIYDSNTYVKEYTYLGIIGEEREGTYRIEQRNKFSVGETIEVMKPNGENVEVTVKRILTEDGVEQESAPHPKQVLYVDLGMKVDEYDILRRREP